VSLPPSSLAGLLALSVVLGACDNRDAFHPLEPGLERMLLQPRATPYGASSSFRDGRAMRPPVTDTVAHERLGRRRLESGRDGTDYVKEIPLPVTRATLELGRQSFDRICATCHGVLGDGQSVVAEKMELRKPPSLHEPRIQQLLPGKVFEVASNGYGFMPAYQAVLSPEERWAVVAYLDVLRLSQSVAVARLTPDMRRELAEQAP
jgi:mono/diheme cytochrome c family protein